jgi:hypothetical protein
MKNGHTDLVIPTKEQRFWSNVAKSEDGCWLWTAGKNGDGYGNASLRDGKSGSIRAHRLSYQLHYGPIHEGMCVLHRCDVRACVRPDHLFIGTHADNAADRRAKGRNARQDGAFSNSAKLTESEVRAIRSDARSQKKIADTFGVSQMTIQRIKAGHSWKNVQAQC